jgi:undecaprenyl-diphosphatase
VVNNIINLILPFDLVISQFIYTFRTPALTEFMLFVTNLGSEYVFSALFLVLALVVRLKRAKHLLSFGLFASLSLPINLLLKSLIARPRPNISPLIFESTTSFPSGHAMNSLVFYFTLVFLIYRLTKNRRLSLISFMFAVIVVLLIGFSRIYLGVHYPTDILGGYLLGSLWFASCIILNKVLHS